MKDYTEKSFEEKYLGAPSFYEINSFEDFKNLCKQQPWEIRAKKEKPIMYYLGYKLPNWFSKHSHILRRKFYELKCWFFPFNRITFTSLPKTWWDVSDGIVNVNFELLERFMENEKPLEFIETEHDEEAKRIWNEIKFLYSWWKQYKTLEIGYENGKYSLAKEEEQEAEATEMLLRLVKIRRHLWC